MTACTDSREALEGFSKNPSGFAILVTDNLMPHMRRIELARKVRALRRDLPVILCSGYLSPEADAEARAEGIQELLN